MKRILFVSLFLSGFFISYLIGQVEISSDPNPTLFQFLYEQDGHVPVMKIETSVKELFRNKSVTEEYYIPGTMSLSQPEGEDLNFKAEFKVRGNTRKKVCSNAPIKLDLDSEELVALGLNKDVDKLKLVIQCENGSRNYQQLLKELLIYDLYEAIDTNGMQVKLIKLEMYENGEKKKDLNAFIVEDEETYAHRKQAKVLEKGKMNYAALNRLDYFKLCFFQYMIANCDWSIKNKHNIELVKLPGVKKITSVPYDFDYCGLVDNNYAVPPEQFDITEVTQRYFMVQTELSKDEFNEVVDFYEGKKDEFMAIIANHEYLEDKTKKSVTSFIEGFYKTMKNRGRMAKIARPKG